MTKPLHGIRVVDLSHVIAGPMASLYLAQLGAEVIKIEPPLAGEIMRASTVGIAVDEGAGTRAGMRTGFTALNAGKRSLAVDIRTAPGAELIRKLAATADVFIENFRPGVVAKHGLGHDAIVAVKPDIVYCSLSGYGQQGEWADRGAYDHVVQALTGMMMMSGDSADAPPVKVGFPVIDVAVGMLGALSIVAAVHRRARDGVGDHIDASMVQAALMLMYPNASSFLSNRIEPQRVGNRGYTGSPTADTYRCADGYLAVAANTPAQFRSLADLLGLESLYRSGTALDLEAFNASGGGFVVARDLPRVQRSFHNAFARQSAAEMEVRLNALGVPAARVRRLGEFLDEVEAGNGPALTPARYGAVAEGAAAVRTPGLGFSYQSDPPRPADGGPLLGQDNRALLSELGYDATTVATLLRTGVIRHG